MVISYPSTLIPYLQLFIAPGQPINHPQPRMHRRKPLARKLFTNVAVPVGS
jgi:hypothetical protein